MKTLKFTDKNGGVHFVKPIRGSASGKTFSDSDTPKGSQSVVFLACKALRANGVNLGFEVPQYTTTQLRTLDKNAIKEGNICPEISTAIMSKFVFLEALK